MRSLLINRREFALMGSAALLAQPAFAADAPASADAINVGGDIIIMNDAQPTAEAVAVRDGVIIGVGSRSSIESLHKGPDTQVIGLAEERSCPPSCRRLRSRSR